MSGNKPKIIKRRQIARTRLFKVEALDLRFSNGAETTFERLRGGPGGAVMVIPVNEYQQLVLTREYMAGIDEYELGFPKGRIDGDEGPVKAADRELKEEAGLGARDLFILRRVAISPAYANFSTVLVVARDLYPARLPGDEPEPPEVVVWPLADIDELLDHQQVTDTRTLLALYMIKAGVLDR